MSELVIQVKNLGKKYVIGHHKQERYTALRDVISNGAKSLVEKFTNPRRASNNNSEDFWALKDISFEIQQGERVGIIGRNGAGKSTLLKVLSRITEPTKGLIKIKGRVASLLEVGTGFHPELTGRENIFLNGAILGMSKVEIKQKFDEIVAFAEVEKFLDTPVKRYSSGMYVRLAFAVAAHLEPEILVVDEVLAVGDATFQKKCLGKMDEVAKNGRTIFFVSHNMAAIRNLCKTAYWLDSGSIKEFGSANRVVDLYEQNAFYKANCQYSSATVNREQGIEVYRVKPTVEFEDLDATLRIEVEGRTTQDIACLGVGVQLTTSEGTLISNIWPRMAKSFLNNVHGDWKCALEYPNINRHLASGDYVIHLALTKPQMGIILKMEDVAIVHIPPVDIYQVGTYFNLREHGIVPLPVNFLV